ncbi:helix-turn-helix domain-containing protein [Falsiphaeobacter marinintestinus]|uniref:helix-turn-helix domain-containing protein n=1 Tax=Falsiphaeobacter marinintestinus TaxID=1492905 RepID=UPI001FEBD8E0|nr:helix-turn-helix transcriptional regulator [Phaeobacter marinintestinus]
MRGSKMSKTNRSPAELRNMFGTNLRTLSRKYPSVSELSRQLGINRTQFNRYLSGESFPRPDVLERICTFFKVDARILLDPVEVLSHGGQVLNGPFLGDFLGVGVKNVSDQMFPSGFYRFTRRSFINDTQFVSGLVFVFRKSGQTYVRGFEAKDAMRQQNLPVDPTSREFRGYVTQQEDGIAMLISRRKAMTCSFNYLSRVASFENNFWVGYVTRTVRESPSGTRATRMVYEHLGNDRSKVFSAARGAGFQTEDDLMPFPRRLLQIDDPFR